MWFLTLSSKQRKYHFDWRRQMSVTFLLPTKRNSHSLHFLLSVKKPYNVCLKCIPEHLKPQGFLAPGLDTITTKHHTSQNAILKVQQGVHWNIQLRGNTQVKSLRCR